MKLKGIVFIILLFFCTGSLFADVSWNASSGDWESDGNWSTGSKPDGTQNIVIGYSSSSVCTLDTDEGMLGVRSYVKNGQTLRIVSGGRFGTTWTRWADGSSATINMSGTGTYQMNDDDLYVGFAGGNCVLTMSDSSTITINDDTDDEEELYIACGGDALFRLNGSNLTVETDQLFISRMRFGETYGVATLEYVMDAGGASPIVTKYCYLGEAGISGTANLVVSSASNLAEEDIVLIDVTYTSAITGNGVFDTLNGGAASEGTEILLGNNVYALTYQYDAENDGADNDVALEFVRSADYMAKSPAPENSAVLGMSPSVLSWTTPEPADGSSSVICIVYFGKQMNRSAMDAAIAPEGTLSIEISADNFPVYGKKNLDDLNTYYWVVDCLDTSEGASTDDGKGLFWTFSIDYSLPPYPYATEPSPAVNSSVDPESILSWQPGENSIRSEVYFGTSSDAVSNAQRLNGDIDGDGTVDLLDLNSLVQQWLGTPSCVGLYGEGTVDMSDFNAVSKEWQNSADSTFLGSTSGSMVDPGVLNNNTYYYWRVDSVNCDGVEAGEVWRFKTKLPAFPGADGFGKWATGGRGGSVYHVTNLNDSGEGSFRDAVSGTNRTIVFDVGGIINIDERIVMSKDITIAGQTAPGEGIMIYGNGVSYTDANRTITRYMRYRMGRYGTADKDAVAIADGTNMIFDHCSVAWGRDENFSISGGTGESPGLITIQDSIIAQGLVDHSCGGLIRCFEGGVSIIRTLYIDSDTRNPQVRGINEFINNVVYNWDDAAYSMGKSSEAISYANVFNNYMIKGPNSDAVPYNWGAPGFHIYPEGNMYDSDRDGILDGYLLSDSSYSDQEATVVSQPYDYPSVNTMLSASASVKYVASQSGASFPARDHTDKYLYNDLLSFGTSGQLISNENDSPLYGVGTLENGHNPIDTDQDGIPDYWEDTVAGLNKYNADNNGDVDGDGYTNLENYINWLGAPHANVQKNVTSEIELNKFTSGFTDSAAFTITNVTHGSAVMLSDGFAANYTPEDDYTGFAELTFTVDDGDVVSITVSLFVSEYGGVPLAPFYPTNLENGLEYNYYEGSWVYLPDFSSLTAVESGNCSDFDIGLNEKEDGFGYEYEALIDIPTDGLYTFYLVSDDGSRLYIDDGVVVSHNGVHGSTRAHGKIALLAGMHKIRVTYFDYSGDQNLVVGWAGPGFAKGKIPATSLYRGAVDIVPPAKPDGLWVFGSNNYVELAWDDNTESDLLGYNVYRTTTTGTSYVKLTDEPISASGYNDSEVTNSVFYYYIVTAVDTSYNESEVTYEAFAQPVSSGMSIGIQENMLGYCGVDDGGSVDNNNAGFTGYGFINTENLTGEGADWTVYIETAGNYTLTWRYASSSDRPADLYVNGSLSVSGISFPTTGSWTTWSQVSQSVYLPAGVTSIRLEGTTTSGLGNIDYIMATGANVIPYTCN